jgi:ATP-binding cassette subfamily F protein 3
MSLLVGSRLSRFFGPDEIFSGISVAVPREARIALVGPNGAGKTTLLNLLVGLDQPSEGEITRAKGVRIGYLPQRPELHGGHTVREEALSAFAEVRALEARLAVLAERLADPAQHDAALAEYGELQERFEAAGGYTYEQRIRTVMQGVGFRPEDFDTPLSRLSGGQKTRALLGRLLLQAPDVLALDEPTNHLDITAVEWLEGYLRDFPGAVIVVSHDRYFLDAVASTVWELDFGSLESYRGNYSAYAQQRAERHERLLREYEAQQEYIGRQEEYIRRHMGSQNTAQAKGRLKRLERLKRDDLVLRPKIHRSMKLRLGQTIRSGDLVLRTFGARVGYPQRALFDAPDIVLRRGEAAALIGPNGAGKSTFVRTIVGELAPLAGEVRLGAAVQTAYFAQAHESLNPDRSILDEILDARAMTISEARSYLGLFLFEGDDVFRPIRTLSGGERGRVALAKLALSGANFLILDEPTNHLDIASQEALQNVLADFDGTILLVSHDRYLIESLATQIWVLEGGQLQVFSGTYHEYIAARDAERLRAAAAREAARPEPASAGQPRTSAKKHGLNPFQLERRIGEIETRIHTLEAELAQLTEALATAGAQGDGRRARALGDAYHEKEAALSAAMEEWALLVE